MHKTANSPEWLRLFKPKVDFFYLLNEQAKMTIQGLTDLHDWLSEGASGKCEGVHRLEHEADQQKLKVLEELRDNFVTPFDREEIYDISARLDLIINGAKKLTKDIEYFDHQAPTADLVEMSALVKHGGELVLSAILHLKDDIAEVGNFANQARKTETAVGDAYRKAVKKLFSEKDVGAVVANKHLYDRMNVIAERIEQLGEKLLHVSIKLS